MTMEARGNNGHATEARASLMDEVLAETERRRTELEPRSMDEVWKLAGIAAKSGVNGVASSETAHVLIQTGRELGLTAMQSLRGLFIEKGKVSMFSDTMVALIRKSGKCAVWDVIETTRDKCTLTAQRVDGKPLTISWTIQEAREIFTDKDRKERLTDKHVWQNYPRQMLRHRVVSEMAREMFPDVTLGLYTPEELDAIPAEDVMRQARQPDPPRAAATTATASADEQRIKDYAARCDLAKTVEDLKALSDEAKAQAPAVRKAFQPLYDAAKARIKPNGDGPKGGGGSPKPEAPANTEAAGKPADVATATGDELVARWTEHMGAIAAPQHAIASHAAHIGEMPAEVRDRCTEATLRRLRAFKWSEGRDLEAELRAATDAKAAA